MVDCRLPNALHREPPFSDLATAGAFSNFDLSNANQGACDDSSGNPQSPCGIPLNISISEIDFVDSFYINSLLEKWPASSVWTIPSKPRSSRSRKYVTMISGISMRPTLTSGSSQLFVSCRWAGAGASGSVRMLSSMRWLHLRWHAPASRGSILKSVSWSITDRHRSWLPATLSRGPLGSRVTLIRRHLASASGLSNRGFAFRVEVETARGSTAIGLMLDGAARTFWNKPPRVWRLYYAIDQLIRQKRASGEALRIVVSHIVSQFLLRRCFLSALSEVWGHIESTPGLIEVMPPRVVAEPRCCVGLILICRRRADRPVSSTAYVPYGCEHTRVRAPGGGSEPFGPGQRLPLAGALAFLR